MIRGGLGIKFTPKAGVVGVGVEILDGVRQPPKFRPRKRNVVVANGFDGVLATGFDVGIAGREGIIVKVKVIVADLVLEHAKVAFVPGEAFGSPGYARFSFALADADMEEGIERIARLVATG